MGKAQNYRWGRAASLTCRSVLFAATLSTSVYGRPTLAAPSSSKIMVLTSTYGVMAGTLTGLASLAFYRSPSKHLRNVALGASLGLYTGIGLGLYLIYFDPKAKSATPTPSDQEDETAPSIDPPLTPKKSSQNSRREQPWQISQRALSAPAIIVPTIDLSETGNTLLGVQVYF